ncbi:hypothetical protein A2Y83_03220 [Candidatus Falkowbacteria bacterium RBG_13_39_14]|uniref:Uncharacterized protein n=1 Tax=Candidatus Falkowbacteria bacterium RBG_13_39_14 TaxID=1797985 RepID=A0A1F5S5T6_9BACT|nr:MAG: hypothetical protein A2Y83_03220 [Candidatus Falkowbacteria bacterium RBG_13_39_14]
MRIWVEFNLKRAFDQYLSPKIGMKTSDNIQQNRSLAPLLARSQKIVFRVDYKMPHPLLPPACPLPPACAGRGAWRRQRMF